MPISDNLFDLDLLHLDDLPQDPGFAAFEDISTDLQTPPVDLHTFEMTFPTAASEGPPSRASSSGPCSYNPSPSPTPSTTPVFTPGTSPSQSHPCSPSPRSAVGDSGAKPKIPRHKRQSHIKAEERRKSKIRVNNNPV